jgi:uncharacterized protein YndB with AHSA1/START domain
MTDERSLELAVEVIGTPDEVWTAIATGPGISSWYVPHTVEERNGGATTASFGAGSEMQVEGRVAAWDPPHRVVFDAGEGVPGLVFAWSIEPRDSGTCIVRLVNSGFGSGEEADAHCDAMAEGWLLFFANLRLHMEHFRGELASASIPTSMWPSTRDETWAVVTTALGIPAASEPGERIELRADDGPRLAGIVVGAAPYRLALLVAEPVPGTAFLAVEDAGDQSAVSIWSYLYGADAAAVVEHDTPRWQSWLDALGTSAGSAD